LGRGGGQCCSGSTWCGGQGRDGGSTGESWGAVTAASAAATVLATGWGATASTTAAAAATSPGAGCVCAGGACVVRCASDNLHISGHRSVHPTCPICFCGSRGCAGQGTCCSCRRCKCVEGCHLALLVLTLLQELVGRAHGARRRRSCRRNRGHRCRAGESGDVTVARLMRHEGHHPRASAGGGGSKSWRGTEGLWLA
jgi:hypothetical protein